MIPGGWQRRKRPSAMRGAREAGGGRPESCSDEDPPGCWVRLFVKGRPLAEEQPFLREERPVPPDGKSLSRRE